MNFWKLTLLLLALMPALVWAEDDMPTPSPRNEDKLTEGYMDCINSHQTNMEWAHCGGEEIQRQEAFMEADWKRASDAMKRLDDNGASYSDCKDCGFKALEKEQKDWEVLQGSACEYTLVDSGREGQVLAYPSCKASRIAERAWQVKLIADDLEERLSH